MPKFKKGDKVGYKTIGLPIDKGIIVPGLNEVLTIEEFIVEKERKVFWVVKEYPEQVFAEPTLHLLQQTTESVSEKEPEAIKLTFSKKVLEKSELLAN